MLHVPMFVYLPYIWVSGEGLRFVFESFNHIVLNELFISVVHITPVFLPTAK